MAANGEADVQRILLKELYADYRIKDLRALRSKKDRVDSIIEKRTALLRWKQQIVRCARTECLLLGEIMYRKLPAELRDIVYQYLCTEERLIPVGPHYHNQHYPLRPWRGNAYQTPHYIELSKDIELDDPYWERMDNFLILPDGKLKEDHSDRPPIDMLKPNNYIFNYRYVGKIMASEALKFYFSNNTFSLCNVDGGIATFLNPRGSVEAPDSSNSVKLLEHMMPSYVLDIKAVDYVRNLQIRIKYEHYTTFRKAALNNATPAETYAFERNFLRKTRDSLYILFSLPASIRELNIEFVIMTNFREEQHEADEEPVRFTNLLQTIRNTVYSFMHDRETATVQVTHHDLNISPFPRDLTGLWSLTKAQWQHEKSVNPGRFTAPDFYIAPAGLLEDEIHDGFLNSERLKLLQGRWGIEDVFRHKKPIWPITEGRYWPVGNRQTDWL